MTTTNPQNLGNLGQRMRYVRQQKGWTQEQLAAKAGTNQAVIQKIENGKSLRPRKIDEIASVLEVNPAWLMFGDELAATLPSDAMALADAWRKLPEPDRSRIQQDILKLAANLPA
jgi:transcriptional regulator with XRE-family HTH domain